jgi:hypothetical protein
MQISGFQAPLPANKAPSSFKRLPLFGLNPDLSPPLTPPQSPLTPPRTPTPLPEDTVVISSPQLTELFNRRQEHISAVVWYLHDVASHFEALREYRAHNEGIIPSQWAARTMESIPSAIRALANELPRHSRRRLITPRQNMNRSIRSLLRKESPPNKQVATTLRNMGTAIRAVVDELPEAPHQQVREPIQKMERSMLFLRWGSPTPKQLVIALERTGKAIQAVAQAQGHAVNHLNLDIHNAH